MTKGRAIETLRRRRDWLIGRVDGAAPGAEVGFDKAEIAALNWALRVLENADALGVLADLGSVDPLNQLVVERIALGQPLDSIRRALGLTVQGWEEQVERLCKLYLCDPDELPQAVIAARRAA